MARTAAGAVVAVLPVAVMTKAVAVDLDEARGRRIPASHASLLRNARTTNNRVMTLDVHHAANQEASLEATSTISNRPATHRQAFLHQASRQATATTSAVDAPAEVLAPVAAITQAAAGLVGQAVRALSAADKALPCGSLRAPPRILDIFAFQRRMDGRRQLFIQ